MIIDIIYCILLVLAVLQGFRRGLIIAVFSFIAVIIGLAAAMKLSTVVADWIAPAVDVSEKWLPVLCFALVFIAVVLLIRLAANALQKLVQAFLLGFVNRIGGILFYACI